MGATLPSLGFEAFEAHLTALVQRAATGTGGVVTDPLKRSVFIALFAHYQLLCQWNPRLSLVGPGTADQVIRRHYAESLAALPIMKSGPMTTLDIGSGGGFPGVVLAAARADCSVILVEARQRKWSFLRAAIRHMKEALKAAHEEPGALSCTALNARIAPPLPPGLPGRLDLVSSRAVHLTEELLGVVLHRWPDAQFLLWRGVDSDDLPAGIEVRARVKVDGTKHRTIVLAGTGATSTTSEP